MAQGTVSTRDLATAYGIMAGKSVSQAMRDAGYAETSARTLAGKVEARLRALGLLPDPQDTRDVIAMLRRVTVDEDGGNALADAFRTHLARARAGDTGSLRVLMEYLVGKPTAVVALTGADGGPVEVGVKVYLGVNPEDVV